MYVRWIYLHDALRCLILDIVHNVRDRVPGETRRRVEQMHYIMNGEGGV